MDSHFQDTVITCFQKRKGRRKLGALAVKNERGLKKEEEVEERGSDSYRQRRRATRDRLVQAGTFFLRPLSTCL